MDNRRNLQVGDRVIGCAYGYQWDKDNGKPAIFSGVVGACDSNGLTVNGVVYHRYEAKLDTPANRAWLAEIIHNFVHPRDVELPQYRMRCDCPNGQYSLAI